MSNNLKFEIDVNAISDQFKDIKEEVNRALVQGVESLAATTHARVLEMASEKLKSTSQTYMDSVGFQQLEKGLWVVSLDLKKAGFIENGQKQGFMEYLLNGKSSKTSKDGKKYAVIAFDHSKKPSEQTPSAQNLTNLIKGELKKRGINWKKIETNPDGTPRVGLLHKININSPRLKEAHKTSPTQGVAIYQKKNARGKVERQAVTFRVITEDHKSEGLWFHPGKEGVKFFEAAFDWALKTWQTEILPDILNQFDQGGKK